MLPTDTNQGIYHSYLVRLWQELNPAAAPSWRGEVIHIQTGKTWTFSGYQPLLEFISTQLAQYDRLVEQGGR
jgi:hypothetical protein